MAGLPWAEINFRAAIVQDLVRLDTLALSDFAVDFLAVQTPTDRSLTALEMRVATDQFVTARGEFNGSTQHFTF